MKSQRLRIGLYPRRCPLAPGVGKRKGVGGPLKLQVAFEVQAGTECDCFALGYPFPSWFVICLGFSFFTLPICSRPLFVAAGLFRLCQDCYFFTARSDLHRTLNYLRRAPKIYTPRPVTYIPAVMN